MHRHPCLVVVAAALLMLGPSARAQQDTCAQQARQTARLVEDLNADATGASGEQPLVVGDAGLARLPVGLVADVTIDGRGRVMFQGQRVKLGDLRKTLHDRVEAEQKKIDMITGVGGRALPSPKDRPLVLAVAPEAPWSSVVNVLKARPQTFDDRVRWLFRVPARAQAPPATWVRRAVDHKALQPRLKAMASASAKVAADCPSYQALLARMNKLPAARRALALEKGVQRSLTGCGCKVPMPALRDLLYVTLHQGEPTGFVQTRVPLDGSGAPLKAAGRRSFQTLAPELLELAASGSSLSVSAR